jgi:N-acetylmuramic acid 6-phosphate (MurNAc-6-P) etherase
MSKLQLSLDQIRHKLTDRRLRIVANTTGLSYQTVLGVWQGTNTNPKPSTIKKLSDYLLTL